MGFPLQSPNIVVHFQSWHQKFLFNQFYTVIGLVTWTSVNRPISHVPLLSSSITHKYWRFEEEFLKLFRIFTTSLTITTPLRAPKLYLLITSTSIFTSLQINLQRVQFLLLKFIGISRAVRDISKLNE